ncbi:MAG: alpha/beta hydrolase, partial [Clostridia bacterium]|nr:alpha/beta hydrolase [Clostridia bacterium]
NERLSEYSPVDFVYGPVGEIEAKGDVYMNWLVNTLKPIIDREFRTLPEREHTSICGTSMGGLMAMYAACVYNDVFKKAACLSASLWIAPDKILSVLKDGNIKKDSVIYIDYGSKEMKNHRESREALTRVTEFLMERDVNVTLRIIPGGTHSEASWEKQIPVFMACLNL